MVAASVLQWLKRDAGKGGSSRRHCIAACLLVAVLAATGLAACAVGPDFTGPAPATPAAYRVPVARADCNAQAPEAGFRAVVDSMRNDARVVSVEEQRDAAATTPRGSTAQPVNSEQSPSTARPIGTVRAGPDGDWILETLYGASYAQQAKDRYECDIWAVGQTGFDPTKDDGGVPPDAVSGKRSDYLRAEAVCFQARGYIIR
jgi:hypothetical protein